MKNPLTHIAPIRSGDSPMRSTSQNNEKKRKKQVIEYGVKLAESTVMEGNFHKAD
jgi:hypothetical protein